MQTGRDTAETESIGFGRSSLERVALYRWLGRVFQRECDAGSLMWHRSEQGRAFLDALAEHGPFAGGAARIAAAVLSDRSIDDEVLRLAGSFSTLFHGVDPRRAAPPYESHYTEESGRLFGEATVKMQEVLARNGLNVVGFSEPADHIAVHLQLMAHFAERAIGHDSTSPAAIELIAAQRDFLRDHLCNWAPDFARDCVQFDASGFYAGAAEILMAFLEEEMANVGAA